MIERAVLPASLRLAPVLLLASAALALALTGCATLWPRSSRQTRPVSIESRSTPRDTAGVELTPGTRRTLLSETVRDTSTAGARLRHCAGRRLLPDQQSLWDSTARLLGDTRSALRQGDLLRARSLARSARQLSTSLSCR